MTRRRTPVQATYVVLTTSRGATSVRADLGASRVLDSGSGTVEDPSAFWFELRGALTLAEVREILTSTEVLRGFQNIVEGAGKDLARQIPLLGGGLWRDGVICGPQPKPPSEPERPKPTVEQMPLFE